MSSSNLPLIVIVGPTAVGKTALSLFLGQQLNGEIISADSRLFYRGMDIGTAKPTAAEQTLVPHHLIDICRPDETVSLGQFQRLAYQTINEVLENGRIPILVGGTGQYVRAVIEGWGIPEVAPQPELRQQLEAIAPEELTRWLRQLDPLAAAKIDPRNVRRVVRALEVIFVTGQPMSALQRKTPPSYRVCLIGLLMAREALYRRIDERIDKMMADGLLGEVEKLRDAGYGRFLPAMSGLGYQQLWAYLDGEMSLEQAVERVKFETHRFVRQQATWFRQDDLTIHWFEAKEGVETAVLTFIHNWLKIHH